MGGWLGNTIMHLHGAYGEWEVDPFDYLYTDPQTLRLKSDC